MIRILHTADWHLGQTFKHQNQNRYPEHDLFLEWLIENIEIQKIDALIVAGDIFDVVNPSSQACHQYYKFLTDLQKTCCRTAIIVGGNHDSPQLLNAPAGLLAHLNVYVTGCKPNKADDCLVPLANSSGKTEAVICAVPFLRYNDLFEDMENDTMQDRNQKIVSGHINYYTQMAELARQKHDCPQVAIIATGHFYASGGSGESSKIKEQKSEKDISYMGNLGQICTDEFAGLFDYIAMGHLHRPQHLSKWPHIRYSGAPIPLSFSEKEDTKQVIILECENGKVSHQNLDIPNFRPLKTLTGSWPEIVEQMNLIEAQTPKLQAWCEARISADALLGSVCRVQMSQNIRELNYCHVKLLRYEIENLANIQPANDSRDSPENLIATSMQALNPDQVFEQYLNKKYSDDNNEKLKEEKLKMKNLFNDAWQLATGNG